MSVSTTSTSRRRPAAGSSSPTRPSRTSSRRPSTRSGCCSRSPATSPRRTRRSWRGAGSARASAGSSSPRRRSGILGFGRIGQQVARRALGLQMRVVAYDPFVSAERFREVGVERDSLDGVLARADFVTLHLPLNDETRGVIDARTLGADEGRRPADQRRPRRARRRAGAARARSSRPRSAGAALDVFGSEPYSGPLLGAPNLVRHARTWPPRPTRPRTAPGSSSPSRSSAALEGGLVTNAVNIPTVGAEDLEVLGPFLPACREPRALRARARARRARHDHARVRRRARRVRHAPAHGRGAQRRLQGPRRPAGQLRQRAAGRGRARHRGGRAAPAQPRPTTPT